MPTKKSKKPAKRLNYIWVIEMKAGIAGRWIPTAGTGLTRDDAKREFRETFAQFRYDKFRIVKYVAVK